MSRAGLTAASILFTVYISATEVSAAGYVLNFMARVQNFMARVSVLRSVARVLNFMGVS